MSKTSTYLAVLVGGVCGWFIFNSFVLGHFFTTSRSVFTDVLQGFLIGFGLAFVTAQIYARLKATRVNGWITMFGLGEPGNGLLLRAAHAQFFPGPVNVPQEAMYWWTNVDGAGRTLSGAHDYVMHFPPGGLTQISSPNNSVLVIGRVLVENDSDLSTAYDLSKQIHLTPLSGWQPGQPGPPVS
jgi:hypothetical protein